MHDIILFVHSWLRWIILLVALIATSNAVMGWLGNKSFEKKDNALNASFVGFMHLQFLLGLILYFFTSPIVQSAFSSGMKTTMGNSGLRFWAVEHLVTMLLAVVAVQVGRSLSKKAKAPVQKHKKAAIWFIIGLVLMLSRIPWGEAGRMFRGL